MSEWEMSLEVEMCFWTEMVILTSLPSTMIISHLTISVNFETEVHQAKSYASIKTKQAA